MRQLSGEALTVLDQSAARKARYQVKETRKQKQRRDKGVGDARLINRHRGSRKVTRNNQTVRGKEDNLSENGVPAQALT